MMGDDSLEIEILDDPEMTNTGQRLIVQGCELLDDSDLNQEERKKVEKIFSECWNRLSNVKACWSLLLRISEGYRQGTTTLQKKGTGLRELFKEFVMIRSRFLIIS